MTMTLTAITATKTAITIFARKFGKEESGATAIEYALMASLIGGAIIVAVTTLGTDTSSSFGEISKAIKPATS